MKNKRFYKYWLSSLGEIATAVIVSYISLVVIYKILTYLYLNTKIQLINYLFKLFRILDTEIFQGASIEISGIILFVVVYLLIIYRKTKSLVAIIDQTELMANGDLDRLIEVNGKNDIKNLAENINNISKQLREITIVERKAQQTKNDLITNVSHDLRTPLTSIIGYLEIIDADKYKDEVRLRYYVNIAFENLLSNSIKYGREGFYVDVTTKKEDDMAVVQVVNYGQSISPIDLPYIFDRFYRVEKSRNSGIGGSGLGLAITKNIIELHQGTIAAYSDENRTVFEVRLPVK